MKNDDKCFKWCISRALNRSPKNPQIITDKLIKKIQMILIGVELISLWI